MAHRPVFIPLDTGDVLVDTRDVDFTWYSGLSVSQKQKSILSLHERIKGKFKINDILEISSKSPTDIGVMLSAFNLRTNLGGIDSTVESVFQGSKVFLDGGPYVDIYERSSRDAKRDLRLKESGPLVKFILLDFEWPIQPLTAFYDWLYINSIHANEDLRTGIMSFSAFTDIEFNPKKSVNCQAYSASVYVSLIRRGIFSDVAKDPNKFISYLKKTKAVSTNVNEAEQGLLDLSSP